MEAGHITGAQTCAVESSPGVPTQNPALLLNFGKVHRLGIPNLPLPKSIWYFNVKVDQPKWLQSPPDPYSPSATGFCAVRTQNAWGGCVHKPV